MQRCFIIKEGIFNNLVKENLNIDFTQFEIKDTLCPQIFNLETKTMLEDVRDKLREIGYVFYEFLEIEPVEYTDIWLTGSLASYNWSKFSDLDLHLLISFNDIAENVAIVENMMWAIKSKFNEKYDIVVNDFKVEVYTQDTENDNLVANGIYSVEEDRWIKFPKKIKKININKDKITKIAQEYYNRYQDILRISQNLDSNANLEEVLGQLDQLSDDIYHSRKRGLESPAGEFSSYNLAYKLLKRQGVIRNITNLSNDIFSTKYSIKTFGLNQDELGLSDEYQGKLDAIKNKKIAIAKAQYGDGTGGEGGDVAFGANRTDYGGTPEVGSDVKKPASKYGVKGKAKYSIEGKKFSTIRQAAKVLNVPKSTVEYRLRSTKPEWANWRYINK